MTYTNRWLSKAKKELMFCYNTYGIFEEAKPFTTEMIQQLTNELGDSKYALEGVTNFLQQCTDRFRFSMHLVTIDVMYNKKIRQKLFQQIIRTLYRANAIFRIFGIYKQDRPIHLVLIPFHEPRKKPENTQDLVKPKHVNGGYTYTSNGTIYIYRLEEWPKVALHELLHNIPKLQIIRWTPAIINQLYSVFQIDTTGCPSNCTTSLEPTEGIIEAWAIFLHTAFMSIEMPQKEFYKLWEEEIQWNDKHIRWAMNKKENYPNEKWREQTHFFSYIVLRGIILHKFEAFLKLPIPYDANQLAQFWITHWNQMNIGKENKNKANHDKNNKNTTLRMSKYGDI